MMNQDIQAEEHIEEDQMRHRIIKRARISD